LIADLRNELNTHLIPQASLFRVPLVATTTVTNFHLSKHTGGGHATSPSLSGLFIYSSRGKCPIPTLQWRFLSIATFTRFPTARLLFYKASCCKVAGQVPPLLCSLAGLFICSSMRDSPSPPLWHSGCPAVFATCLFCCFLIQFGFFSFFPG
jgi:hypothetical protein